MSNQNESKENKTAYMPLGMCLGLSIGTAIGVAMDNLAIGMCLGMSVGMSIGSLLDAKNRKKTTDEPELPEEKTEEAE
jgi:hypothetical protein